MGLENRVLESCVLYTKVRLTKFSQSITWGFKIQDLVWSCCNHSQATMKNLQDGSSSHKQSFCVE